MSEWSSETKQLLEGKRIFDPLTMKRGAYYKKPPSALNILPRMLRGRILIPIPTPDHVNVLEDCRVLPVAWKSFLGAGRYKRDWDSLQAFVLFLGYSRSGHSILGSVLDAHPEMLVAHEADVFQLLDFGFSREQIFYMIMKNSQAFAAMGRGWSGRSHEIAGQWQGRFSTLKVIGDKKGAGTVWRIMHHHGLLSMMAERIGLPLKFLHVTRNPFDNISTMCRVEKKGKDLPVCISNYFRAVKEVNRIAAELPPDTLLHVRYESLVRDPKTELTRILKFLGLSAPEDYLEACRAVFFETPHQSRHKIKWDAESRRAVDEQMKEHGFLADYGYEK